MCRPAAWVTLGLDCKGGRRLPEARDLISMRQAAAYSGLSPSHLRLLARTGRLPAWRLGQEWFTTREAVAGYLKDEALRKRGPRRKG